MRNRYPGPCYRCNTTVAAGAGHFERIAGGWRVQHADCAIRWRGKPAPTVAEARAARPNPWRDGRAIPDYSAGAVYTPDDPCCETAWLANMRRTERNIRRELRDMVAAELKYTTRGRRGAGLTYEPILIRVRQFRRQHTASIARERADLLASAGYLPARVVAMAGE